MKIIICRSLCPGRFGSVVGGARFVLIEFGEQVELVEQFSFGERRRRKRRRGEEKQSQATVHCWRASRRAVRWRVCAECLLQSVCWRKFQAENLAQLQLQTIVCCEVALEDKQRVLRVFGAGEKEHQLT